MTQLQIYVVNRVQEHVKRAKPALSCGLTLGHVCGEVIGLVVLNL